MLELITAMGCVFPVAWWIKMVKDAGQRKLDAERAYYQLTFPADMSEKQIHAFIRSIGKNLRGGSTVGGVPTIVFELWSSPATGITHRLRLPKDSAPYLMRQLQSALPGIDVNKITEDVDISGLNVNSIGFQFGATLHMANSSEELPIVSTMDYSHRVLASMQDANEPHDALCVQWIIAHSNNQKMPPSDRHVKSERSNSLMWRMISGERPAGRDELKSRRNKQTDQVYVAVGRIAARAKQVARAEQLVRQVVRAYTSEGGYAHFYAKRSDHSQISHDIRLARTPFALTAQLSVKELGTVIGWPMGDVYVPGLDRGTTRHLPAPESVPRSGRVLGISTMPGTDRVIAMDYVAAVTHTLVAGMPGSGKTTTLVNLIRQDMENGNGVFVIERDGDLFRRALEQVPPHRMRDVICIDLAKADRPVGLNILRLNRPEVIAGQLATLLDSVYPDANTSIYAHQLVLHGIPILANLPRATIADLIPLVHPRNPSEKAWAKWAIDQHPDPLYRNFWEDWHKRDAKKLENDSQALKNRMWDLLTPEPTRYLLNQETSSFNPDDIITGNKIFLVNLAGPSDQSASLIGTEIVHALWASAQRLTPDKPNFLFIDEFYQFSHLGDEFAYMIANARKRKLGLVIATQFIEQLTDPLLRKSVMANIGSKMIFKSPADSAKIYAKDFASPLVKDESFMNLPAYTALARINVGGAGVSAPLTLKTHDEPKGYGQGREILDRSATTYGRDVAQIQHDDSTRRKATSSPSPKVRKDIGRSTSTID